MRNINWPRGFNRVYVILCVMWIFFAIWYQLNYQRTVISDKYALALQTAYDSYGQDHVFKYIDAQQRSETDFQNAWKKTGVIEVLKQSFLTWSGLEFVVLPPLLLYALILGICFIVRWIARGFMAKSGA